MTRTAATLLGVFLVLNLALLEGGARAQYADPPPPPGYGGPSAQPYAPLPPPPPPPAAYRSGWYVGVALGGGSIRAHDDGATSEPLGAFLADLHFGGMVTPRLGLQVELWAAIHDYEDYENSALVLNNVGLAAQYWITPRLWLKGGVGSATLEYQMDGETLDSIEGTSFLGGVGYELVQQDRLAIDVQFNTTTTGYADGGGTTTSSGLLVGVNWY